MSKCKTGDKTIKTRWRSKDKERTLCASNRATTVLNRRTLLRRASNKAKYRCQCFFVDEMLLAAVGLALACLTLALHAIALAYA